jgi:hypothetical protein
MSRFRSEGMTSDNALPMARGCLQRHALTRADPRRRGTLGQMRQCRRSPRDQHGMASDRFPHADHSGVSAGVLFPVGRDGGGVVGEQFVQAPGDGAESAPPVVDPPGCRSWATAPGGVGRVAQRAQRLVEGSRRAGAASPQPAQRIHRCLHAKHQGLSVSLETTHAAVRPQTAHVRK